MCEQDQGVTPSGPGCQPSASAPPLRSGSSQSGIPNAETFARLAARLEQEANAWAVVADYTLTSPRPALALDQARSAAELFMLADALRSRASGAIGAGTRAAMAIGADALKESGGVKSGLKQAVAAHRINTASGIVAAEGGRDPEGLDERSEQSPVAKPDAQTELEQ